ncbi:MAG: helix-turn-helix domain-containing protein [Phycisphaerales bacterium]|jgi:AraC-like DNA-binding protein|nr:helix-turn-helix domain-containing protein [Phycisphaerales bacterium]
MEWWYRIHPQVHETWHGRWKPGQVEPLRTLRDHELVLFTQGVCEVEMEGRKWPCPAGTALVVPPGVLHTTRGVDGVAYRYCVHFDWVWSRRAQSGRSWWVYWPAEPKQKTLHEAPTFLLGQSFYGSFDPGHSPVVTLVQTLCHRWNSDSTSDRHSCRALMLEALVRLFAPADQASPGRHEGDELAFGVRTLLHGIQVRHDSIIETLGGLGYSYEHLCRAFTRKFGISPSRYLMNQRMERAKQMLREPGKKIAAIANELGYEAGYFIRLFRKYAGITPGEYARHEHYLAK